MTGFDRLDTHVSYFQGSVSSRWHADVPAWGGVRYTDLYPGLDLEISGQGGQWSWRLVVRNPSTGLAQLANVAWQVDGAAQVSLVSQQLRLQSVAGNYDLPLLRVVDADGAELSTAQLQEAGASAPSLVGDQLREPFLALATSGAGQPHGLADIIPAGLPRPASHGHVAPLLDANPPSHQVYGSYLGGTGYGVAAGEGGSAYVTGLTFSSDFTYTVGYTQTQNASADAYVIKFSPDGSSLYYLTHLGGDQDDVGLSIAVDDNGAAYMTGYSNSSDYPTTLNAYDPASGGPMLSKLSADGTSLEYSGFLGHNGSGHGIAVQPHVNNVVYVSGYTDDNSFPTTMNAYSRDRLGDLDGFLSKVDTSQSGDDSLVYSTFFGGNSQDCGSDVGRSCSVAVDRYGYVYLSGRTWSTNIPTTAGAFDTVNAGGADGFLLKLDATISGTAGLLYGTYLGGSGDDCYGGCYVAVNGNQSAYVTGATNSTDLLTTTSAYNGTFSGGTYDVFAAKINTLGSSEDSLVYSTYLGGALEEVSLSIAVNAAGEATIAGDTNSMDFPTTADAFASAHNGDPCDTCRDLFVSRLSADGTSLLYSTYLGGTGDDIGWSVAVQPHNDSNIFVASWSTSSDYPVTGGAYYNAWFPGVGGELEMFSLTTCQTTP